MSIMTILETLLIGPLKMIFEIVFVIANRMLGENPGMAIIALSLLVNTLLLPLYRRVDAIQDKAREKEDELRDGVALIKKAFSGDERMMILQTYYRQNNYKPTDALNGSVSLLLEVPFFMAAYQMLSNMAMLNGVSFGPIRDLGAPDGMLVMGSIAINILPILMTAINILSGMIYSKGLPLKSKIQMYGLAVVFLVLLYDSPAGLVFYWTLNNVFSLCKNILNKTAWAKKFGMIALFGTGCILAVYGGCFYQTESMKRKLFVIIVGLVMMLPEILQWVGKRFLRPGEENLPQPNQQLFTLGSVFITVLTGLWIPTTYIAASTLEFVLPGYYYNPSLYILSAVCYAAGTFFVWLRVFYWLANEEWKVIIEKAVWVLCAAMLVNYMLFGRNLGIISADLVYEEGMSFGRLEMLANLAVNIFLAGAMLLALKKWPRPAISILLTVTLAIGGIAIMNLSNIRGITTEYEERMDYGEAGMPQFRLSQTGNNVVVIMLDRSLGVVVPYILQEKPELEAQLEGFTYYSNTISHGGATNFGTPGLFGGYEYTPVEMNRRSAELLKDKHNEALKVMPVLFSENDFEVTVFDPTYANYSWIPDVSIFEDRPQIKAVNAQSYFGEERLAQNTVERRNRNIFCFSLMKTLPVILQKTLYCDGNYNYVERTSNVIEYQQFGTSVSKGIKSTMYAPYQELNNMDAMTDITSENIDTFLMMSNDITHESALLQTPEYEMVEYVDNTQYDLANQDRFFVDGAELHITEELAMSYYHANMAAFIQLGKWFDYLRENDVYDNTRIIIVGDHGSSRVLRDELMLDDGSGSFMDLTSYYPLLMVKDFGSREFTNSDTFMTNADVPTLAVKDLIRNPLNPFTGKPIDDSEKTAHKQYIIVSEMWDTEINNGNTFLPAMWLCVEDSIWDQGNWDLCSEEVVLTENSFPE